MNISPQMLLNELGIVRWQKRPLAPLTTISDNDVNETDKRASPPPRPTQEPRTPSPSVRVSPQQPNNVDRSQSSQSMPSSQLKPNSETNTTKSKQPANSETNTTKSKQPANSEANTISFRLHSLCFAQTCILYLSDDNPAVQDLIERMFIKCGAKEGDIRRADLIWPPTSSFLAAGYTGSSPESACQGFLKGLDCSLAVIMGKKAEEMVRTASGIRFIRIDAATDLLRQREKRKIAWEALDPLKKELKKEVS